MNLRFLDHLHRRARLQSSQRGYVLLITLGVMALSFIIVTALLALAAATMGLSGSAARLGSMNRAVDAAMDAAVSQLRMDTSTSPTPHDNDGTDGCSSLTASQISPVGTPNGQTLSVTCTSASGFTSPKVAINGTAAQKLYVTGDQYYGDFGYATDCSSADLSDPAANLCMPWTADSAATIWSGGSLLNGSSPTLIHQGPKGLGVTADVLVKKTALTQLWTSTTPHRPDAVGTAGIAVGGTYEQGTTGVGGTGTGSDACGLLSTQTSGQVGAVSALIGSVIDTLNADPVCGSTTAQSLNDESGQGTPNAPWTAKRLRETTARTAPTSCSGSPVTINPGEYTAAESKKLMNLMKSSSCFGKGKVYVFPPGSTLDGSDFWFDVNDSTYGNTLLFDDPTATYVWGTRIDEKDQSGNKVGDTCDTKNTAKGVSLTLSSRTRIKHTAGKFVLCPKIDTTTNTKLAALVQDPHDDPGQTYHATSAALSSFDGTEVPVKWGIGRSVTGAVAVSSGTLASALRDSDNNMATGTIDCRQLAWGTGQTVANGTSAEVECASQAKFTLTGWARDAGTVDGATNVPLSSAVLLINGSSDKSNYSGSKFANDPTIDVTVTPAGSSTPCSATFDALMGESRDLASSSNAADRWRGTIALDLLDPNAYTLHTTSKKCTDVLKDSNSLINSTITVQLNMVSECSWYFHRGNNDEFAGSQGCKDSDNPEYYGAGHEDDYGFKIDSISLRTGIVMQPSTTTSSDFTNDGNVKLHDGSLATSQVNCGRDTNSGGQEGHDDDGDGFDDHNGCDVNDVKDLDASEFDRAYLPISPTRDTAGNDGVATVGVLLTGESRDPSGNSNGHQQSDNGHGADDGWDTSSNGDGAKVQVTVTLPDRNSCVAEIPRLPDDGHTLYIDLLDASLAVSGQTKCSTLLGGNAYTVEDLQQATVRISETLKRRFANPSHTVYAKSYIDRVGLLVTRSEPYTGPIEPNWITSDGTNASFLVQGGASMQRSTLDVHWDGAPLLTPIFNAESAFGAVGSLMKQGATMGTLCCSPGRQAERLVEIKVTSSDGVLRGRALVRVSDNANGVFRAGASVTVLDWRLCPDGKCDDT